MRLLWCWTSSALAAVTAAAAAHDTLVVDWHAPFLSGGGYCSEATTFVLALEALDDTITVRASPHGDSYSKAYVQGQAPEKFAELERLLRRRQKPDVVICHSEPGAWHVPEPSWSSTACPPKNLDKGAIVVGRTMFETDRLPEKWPERLNAVDEVWVPTEFHADVFRRGGVPRVYVLGEPVDTDAFRPAETATRDGFVVLSVFKWEARKGWDVLLRGWRDAFSTADDCPSLVLLTNAYHSKSDFELKLDTFARDVLFEERGLKALCPVRVLTGLSQPELEALYRNVDVLAMPTRGEGWGRPHVEAMASGTPVIATNWSGPTAFLTEANGYPLHVHDALVPVGGDGPFRDHLWADPDPAHLAELLRRARDFPDERRAKGKRARDDVVARFSPSILAAQVRDRLAFLTHNLTTTHSSSSPPRRRDRRSSSSSDSDDEEDDDDGGFSFASAYHDDDEDPGGVSQQDADAALFIDDHDDLL